METIDRVMSRALTALRPPPVLPLAEWIEDTIHFPATVSALPGRVRLWAYQRGVILDFSRPGKPTDNAFIEAFNGRFRQECLNTHWFMNLAVRSSVQTIVHDYRASRKFHCPRF